MRNISSLTGVRGVAALWVMLYHVSQMGPAIGAHWIANVGGLSEGWIGVDLFFVLSGFILMWAHGPEFAYPSLGAFRRFFATRFVRVYPLSFLVLVLIVLLAWADPHFVTWCRARNPDNFSFSAFLRTAFLATRWIDPNGGDWNQPVWSLSAEIVGYAAFPLLAWAIATCSIRTVATIAAICLAALAAFQISMGTASVNTIDQVSALARMACCFTVGIATCRLRDRMLSEHVSAHTASVSLVICLALGACLQFRTGHVLAPLGFAALVFCLSFGNGVVNQLLSSNVPVFLGRISFPLYLFHVTPLLWIVSHCQHAHLGQGAATSVLLAYGIGCVASAWLLHHLVEQPLHRWAKRRFPAASERSLDLRRLQRACALSGGNHQMKRRGPQDSLAAGLTMSGKD